MATSRSRSPARDAPAPRRRQGALGDTVTHRLHTLAKLTDKVTQAAYLAETGLPLGEGRCLAAVGAFAPLSVKDLARMANVDKGQASRAAQALVDKGLVRKQPSAVDARGVVLSFTPAGELLWRRLMAVIRQRNDAIVGCLTADERAQFGQLLTRLVAHARVLADGLGDRAAESSV
ncbi:MAG: MarR family transcriptional regulator [Burkholderiales bacterium]|nr:MarR family transcriptional regulator [Burkholderiales bacterium]MBK8666567.1 MarR family transcriptional regulator [Burkholderiales bacterium]